MTTELTSKQVYEAYAISFDFGAKLGAETIASVTVTAVDQVDSSDVSLTLLDPVKQSNTDTVVYLWVRAGTSGHDYLITVKVVGSSASQYELEAILPVEDTPATGTTSGGGLVTPPAIEPISLAELKLHLRLDSGSFADNVDTTQSIAPGNKAIANNYTTHVGTAVEVIGYTALVNLISGTNGATGTVDVKIQDSDDNITFTDWGTAFTQVTTANDNATYEKAYTGTKRYIRTVAKVLSATCDFGTTIIRLTATSYEDDLLTAIIEASREHIEDITRRALITQVWDYSLRGWPTTNYIKIPGGNLQSVTSIKWKATDGTETTLTAGTDYLVETNGDQCGRVVLPYGCTWPSGTLYPSNPITIRYVAGWTTAALVPSKIRTAVKMIAADLYENREGQVMTTNNQAYSENKVVQRLLASARLRDEFE